jgi:hypothetical protein
VKVRDVKAKALEIPAEASKKELQAYIKKYAAAQD